jgi:hypothetical protein
MGFGQIVASFRKTETARTLLSLGTALGLPVPYLEGSRLYILLPLLERLEQLEEHERVPLRKPVGELRFDSLSGRLTKFQLYQCEDPMPDFPWNDPFTWFPPRVVIEHSWSRDRFLEEQSELFARLDDIIKAVKLGKKSDSNILGRFKDQFSLLVESEMIEYYRTVVRGNLIVPDLLSNEGDAIPKGPMTPFD